ncbi:MAG: beta-propeller domain-containing protein [Oscillospiraceae bacterium]|nr:beta-propeller domain-containing protein [Oscillospiraceae bacterium]
MSFDKRLKAAIEDIEVPPELSPERIEEMLRGIMTDSPVSPVNTETDTGLARGTKIVSTNRSRSQRSVIMRTIAAAAAFAALAGGFAAYSEINRRSEELESEKDYRAVQVQSYDELYDIYTEIYLNNSSKPSVAENGEGVEIITDETAITGDNSPVMTEANTVGQDDPKPNDGISGDNPGKAQGKTPIASEVPEGNTNKEKPAKTVSRSDFSDADIVKSDDSSIYYICGGTLYVVDKASMTVTSEITSDNPPFEMYIRGNALVLVSEASDGIEKNAAAEIYDTSSGRPVLIRTYKQNGAYTSARVDESGLLYLMTGYSNYRGTAPLGENASLESFVPAYYVDGEKKFVAAEDIAIPQGANNTDYTVISCVDCNGGGSVSVKAVLGSSANSYCSADTLYVAGTGVKDGRAYTAVTSFSIGGGQLLYKASTVLDGELISSGSMSEAGGMFRIACRSSDENGVTAADIYTLDESLAEVMRTDRLLPGTSITSVRFEDSFASLFEANSEEPAMVVDLNHRQPVDNENARTFLASYVNPFGSGIVGVTAIGSGEGSRFYSALKLEMYDTDSGESISEITFAEVTDVTSPALEDKNAMLIDEREHIIGVPVSGLTEFGVVNRYYVFTYAPETGFVEKGCIEYNDIEESFKFERAMVDGENLIIIGSGRMVSVRLSDMTVIDTVDFPSDRRRDDRQPPERDISELPAELGEYNEADISDMIQ